MSSYYIDYENVHNEGLNGIEKLEQGSSVCLFYSCKADTLKIDVVRQLMGCDAEIRFEKIDNGVENALDFQLITALMCSYSPEDSYYIISKDKGYDAAIEMAAKQGRDNIYRCRDIDGALKHQSGLGIDESDQEVIVELDLAGEADASASPAQETLPEPEGGSAPAWETAFRAEESDNLFRSCLDAFQAVPARRGYQAEEQEEQEERDAQEVQEVQAAQEAQEEAGEAADEASAAGSGAEPTAEELQRRAYQSICTKLLNHIKLIHKIPLNYKQAGVIYEALSESDSKMQFYHKLIQILGRKKGGELYQRVKTTYKSITAIYRASLNADSEAEGGSGFGSSGFGNNGAGVRDEAESIRDASEEAEENQGNPGNPGDSFLKMAEPDRDI